MKHKLNLNIPGTKLVTIIGVFLALIPACLYVSSLLLNLLSIKSESIGGLIQGSIAIGAVLFAMLLILMIIEQIQDHYLDVSYRKNRSRKLKISTDYFECQYCGNRRVRGSDKNCLACGKRLTDA